MDVYRHGTAGRSSRPRRACEFFSRPCFETAHLRVSHACDTRPQRSLGSGADGVTIRRREPPSSDYDDHNWLAFASCQTQRSLARTRTATGRRVVFSRRCISQAKMPEVTAWMPMYMRIAGPCSSRQATVQVMRPPTSRSARCEVVLPFVADSENRRNVDARGTCLETNRHETAAESGVCNQVQQPARSRLKLPPPRGGRVSVSTAKSEPMPWSSREVISICRTVRIEKR